jgi:hypothetical protein
MEGVKTHEVPPSYVNLLQAMELNEEEMIPLP